jgi:hypothetical protein
MPKLKNVRRKLMRNGFVKDKTRSEDPEIFPDSYSHTSKQRSLPGQDFWVDCVENGRDIWFEYHKDEFVWNIEVLSSGIRDVYRDLSLSELLELSKAGEMTGSQQVDRFGYVTSSIIKAIRYSRLRED